MYLLILTGLSGAGKTSALKLLEDDGFYCVDNMPLVMLPEFIALCRKSEPEVKYAAVAVDAREYNLNHRLRLDLAPLNIPDVDYEILFLECRNEVLSRRYNATRRQHPMSKNVADGILLEREYLAPLRDRSDYILDTSELKSNDLRKRLFETLHRSVSQNFNLVIQSFGYKNGIPYDTDIVYDMRFVRNPFYIESLRVQSGLDADVKAYIEEDSHVSAFMDSAEQQLRYLIPLYIENNKRRLIVSFGCTGGRHRSVYGADTMYNRLKDSFQTDIIHRDLKEWNG